MPQLDIFISDALWQQHEPQDGWQKFFDAILATTLGDLKEDVCFEELSLSLVHDETSQKLNAQFRAKNAATNVLAFPSIVPMLCLGDIVLAFDTIYKEAIEQQKPFLDHVSHLFVHGLLHLIGYDHIEEHERVEMEAKEIQILKKLAIGNPYVS